MKNDLVFSCIAIPFTIGFGMASSQPIWAMAVFAAMLLLRYAGAPAVTVGRGRSPSGRPGNNMAGKRYLSQKTPAVRAEA